MIPIGPGKIVVFAISLLYLVVSFRSVTNYTLLFWNAIFFAIIGIGIVSNMHMHVLGKWIRVFGYAAIGCSLSASGVFFLSYIRATVGPEKWDSKIPFADVIWSRESDA